MKLRHSALPLAGLLLVSACATLPDGPSAMVLPGTGKTFTEFRNDDAVCRNFALGQIGGNSPNQVANQSGVSGAAVGTLIGAAAGAALGGDRNGAAAGAAMGLLMGSAVGADNARVTGGNSQRRYDYAYEQCMYASGHRIPVQGGFLPENARVVNPTGVSQPVTATTARIPPPPPGSPPPPPPGVK